MNGIAIYRQGVFLDSGATDLTVNVFGGWNVLLLTTMITYELNFGSSHLDAGCVKLLWDRSAAVQ